MNTIEPQDYVHKTKPLQHQERLFLKSRDLPYYGNLSEQGTGKTKIFIDTACWLYNKGEIDAVLVVAPNGVHENWVHIELPTHFPDHTEYYAAAYYSQPRAKERKAMEELWKVYEDHVPPVLNWLCMNVEALSGKKAKEYARKWLNSRRCLFIVDESHTIKTPGVARTRTCLTLSKHADYKRIATGTPATENPLAFYSQMRFLDDSILGFNNFYSFKAQYAILEEEMNWRTRKRYKVVVGYQNIDELMEKINGCTDRVLKADCVDLPDKVYEKRIARLNDEQKQLYNALLNKTQFEIEGENVVGKLAMTRLMQMQQVCGGFLIDPNRHAQKVGKSNPKWEATKTILEEVSTGKVIIYARFKAEINLIADELRRLYGSYSVVEYHGGVKKKDRQRVTESFQSDPEVKYLVAQPAAAVGVTWTEAHTVIYFSNEFSLLTRLQSEDRPHRIGQNNKVTYYDIVVPGTVDEKVINALVDKKEFSEALLDDPITNWITV